jgi:ubiquinone/menaquinone biosynthesis C-methylase UbiE
MKKLKEEIAKSLDATTIELIDYLPYLLQDLWELGTNPNSVLELIKKYSILESINAKVLDLGCGKGAVSIAIAKEFGVKVYGIDAMESFIEEAKNYANKFDVSDLCKFEVNDIKEVVQTERGYDLVILGAVGQVFGDYKKTLSSLSRCIKNDGHLIIDDGYINDDSDYSDKNYLKHEKLLEIIKELGLLLVEERIEKNIETTNKKYYELIKKRAGELKKKYPSKALIFEDYVDSQEKENYILENNIMCAVFVLKKIYIAP